MVKSFFYKSGEEIRCGDRVLYHGEQGAVEFVVISEVGDEAIDWYHKMYPGGGCMINANGFGNIFLTSDNIDEDLVFQSRPD